MGATQSYNQTSNVSNINNPEGYKVIDRKNGLEIIDIDFNLQNTETDSISEIFNQIDSVTRNIESEKNDINTGPNSDSSPFVSPEMYHKIMNGEKNEQNSSISSKSAKENNNVSSPFINSDMYNNILNGGNKDGSSSPFMSTDEYNKMMKGGFDSSSSSSSFDDSDDSTSDSDDIMKALSSISLSSNQKFNPKKGSKTKKSQIYSATSELTSDNNIYSNTSKLSSIKNNKRYGFSNTSSEIIKTSENNYFLNNELSDTPYKIDSSSINTSDVNLISVDSRNGRRFI